MTEGKALKELQRGSQQALAWFIDKYTPYVSTIIYNIIGGDMSTADIEEVASDVFFALWTNAEKVRSSSVKAYLGSIARNMAKNKTRERGNALPLDEDILIVDNMTPETRLEQKELNMRVRHAVLLMEYPDREIFLRLIMRKSITAVMRSSKRSPDIKHTSSKTRWGCPLRILWQ